MYPTDEAYLETRRILAGLATPNSEYQALIDWIASRGEGGKVLNAVYSRPWLTIVMEQEEDAARLVGDEVEPGGSRDQLAGRFREILFEQKHVEVDAQDVRAVVTAFAPAARIAANHNVPSEMIAEFQLSLDEPTIWLVRPNAGHLRVFFHTDEQLAASADSGIRQRVADEYRSIVAPYDEFGFVQARPITPVFDSRERFDRDYRGNWQGYDRDNP